MKYKVVTTCFGFKGRKWTQGTVVDIDPSENPPKHFVPLETLREQEPVKVPHRTEPMEMEPGKNREVEGGFAHSTKGEKLDRILTTDKVPNNVEEKPKLKKARKKYRKKGAGSAKKSD